MSDGLAAGNAHHPDSRLRIHRVQNEGEIIVTRPRRPLYYMFLLLSLALVGGGVAVVGGPSLVQEASAAGTTPIPAEGKALVVFFRPLTGTSFLDGARSTLFEIKEQRDPQAIGIGGGGTKVVHEADPGKHLFMVVGETADFMTADLLPNSTYHVTVVVSAGKWRARYALRPTDQRDMESGDFKQLLAASSWTESAAAAQSWAASNMPSIRARYAQYYPPWASKPDAQRAGLLPTDRVSVQSR